MRIRPKRSAVVVVDMWDKHWCKTYCEDLDELAPRVNEVLWKCRRAGMEVMHMPAGTMEFYAEHPARLAAQDLIELVVPPGGRKGQPKPVWPCGCGPDGKCKAKKVWTRQHPAIEIVDEDFISETADHLYAMCVGRGIRTLFYVGGAAGGCVLERDFGMNAMSDRGFTCVVVRDMTITYRGPREGVFEWIGVRYAIINSKGLVG